MGWQDDQIVAKGKRKWEADPIVARVASQAAPASPGKPAIDIRPGAGAPAILATSANPYSQGRYPLGRIFTVGDEASFRETDVLTGAEKRTYTFRVTRVDAEADRVEINDGIVVMDLMGNALKLGNVEFDAPPQFAPSEFQLGKKWRVAFVRTESGKVTKAYYDVHIARREKVAVPAGEFDAFMLESQGWNITYSARLEVNLWLVPGLQYAVKREWVTRDRWGRFTNTERHELASIRQQAIGL
ncbi:MAG: hypothetical protein AMXMBFR31_26890 [Candidatus Desulfobacillus denitrificans]|jgi:hypothetical protein|uniref:Uncharacterized protein n=1 Tax=Candidatus Desulfobacillus denitrificans TaxID=2608985 RepID=A0A809SAV9_9PROT|nr:hypothetical protein [Rhodocyclaceae bacterium]BBO21164.1 conserved hypothetical protein [Candidatus Desulfobacillus denitrificans]GIK45814.1 MAG: hypothetical protein BroJett012_17170 [Betaproteobacteria bacterium]GJQ53489.1 MAG: hypothetical protein HKUEN07_00580 [Rhodocyclaceae bacterium]